MTCDLFRKLWRNTHAQESGTQGARQHGVDVFGVSGKKKRVEGVHCKRTIKLTADEVREGYRNPALAQNCETRTRKASSSRSCSWGAPCTADIDRPKSSASSAFCRTKIR